jgi:hypothetical protein
MNVGLRSVTFAVFIIVLSFFFFFLLIFLLLKNFKFYTLFLETIVHLFVHCPYLDNFRKLIKDFIKADLHVDTFSMDIQNIILYNVNKISSEKLIEIS